jgi:hypothetical protein
MTFCCPVSQRFSYTVSITQHWYPCLCLFRVCFRVCSISVTLFVRGCEVAPKLWLPHADSYSALVHLPVYVALQH